MRIGMILDSSFPPDPRVENEAKYLISNGHEVFLYCISYSAEKKYENYSKIQVARNYFPKWIRSLSSLAYTFPFYHSLFKKSLKKFLIENKIEAIHIHDMAIARAVFNVAKNSKTPIVLDLHENRPEIMKYYKHVNSLLGKLLISPNKWKKFEYDFISQADKLIVVTEQAKKYYLKHVKIQASKIHVVPNSILPEFYNKFELDNNILNEYDKDYCLVYLGDTGERRGLMTAIDSLKILSQKIPNIKLIIVGSSSFDQHLKAHVAQNNLTNWVSFVGWQNPNKFQSFLKVSKIGICPLHKNIHHDTTYANKVFQYLSFGLPAIVSNCNAQEQLIKKYKCGLIFQEKNVAEFADKVLTLYQDQELYDRQSKNAKEAIENHLNWNHQATSLKALYSAL